MQTFSTRNQYQWSETMECVCTLYVAHAPRHQVLSSIKSLPCQHRRDDSRTLTALSSFSNRTSSEEVQMRLMAVVYVNSHRMYIHTYTTISKLCTYIHVYICALIQYMPYIHTLVSTYSTGKNTPNELQQVMPSTRNSTPTLPHYHFHSTSASALTWDCNKVPICCMESKQDGTSTELATVITSALVHTYVHTYVHTCCMRARVRTYVCMRTHSADKHTHTLKHIVTCTHKHPCIPVNTRSYITTNVLMLTIIT